MGATEKRDDGCISKTSFKNQKDSADTAALYSGLFWLVQPLGDI